VTRRLGALFVKELRTLFASPIAYVVLTAYVALSGVYFFQHLLNYNRLLFVFQGEGIGTSGFDTGTLPLQVNSLNELFIPAANDFSLFLLAVLPLVTMRVFAEERAQGTDELLLTTPLRTWELVLAKHATTYLFVMLMIAASAIYPAMVVIRSQLGLDHLLALYLGQLSYGVAIAAIGLACSSITSSQLVAAMIAYAIPFALLDFAWLEPLLSESAAALLREVAILGHLDGFTRGVIELRHVVYFSSATVLGFVVSMASLEMSRAR
jgi:ABC-2 type transport system permease protein